MAESSAWNARYDQTFNQPLRLVPYAESCADTVPSPSSISSMAQTRLERADNRYHEDGVDGVDLVRSGQSHSSSSAHQPQGQLSMSQRRSNKLLNGPMQPLATNTGGSETSTTEPSSAAYMHSARPSTADGFGASRSGGSRFRDADEESRHESHREKKR